MSIIQNQVPVLGEAGNIRVHPISVFSVLQNGIVNFFSRSTPLFFYKLYCFCFYSFSQSEFVCRSYSINQDFLFVDTCFLAVVFLLSEKTLIPISCIRNSASARYCFKTTLRNLSTFGGFPFFLLSQSSFCNF